MPLLGAQIRQFAAIITSGIQLQQHKLIVDQRAHHLGGSK